MKRRISIIVPIYLALFSMSLASAAAAQMPSDPPPLNPGTLAPHFTTKSLSGKPFDSNQMLGHVTILDFWATWCGTCKAEMPSLQRLSRDYASKKVNVIGMCGDTYTLKNVRPTLKQLRITYANMVDPHECLKIEDEYNAEPLPSIYVIDSKGIVRFSQSGGIDDKTLRKILDTVIKTQ